MTGKIEKEKSITKIDVIGGKVCVITEKRIAEDKKEMWLNSERF